MDDLKTFAKHMVSSLVYNDPDNEDTLYQIYFGNDIPYALYSTTLSLDSLNGICTDGESKSIRYENIERGRIFKMKAGKFITRCIEECRIPREYMPEQLKRWIGEEFARDWQVYAEQRVSNDYTLHVDDDFEAIYDSDRCLGDFGSCMTDKGHYTFYRDAIKAKAAYITDEDDMIVARCIVYTDVWDENNNHYSLAERQYSSGQDDVLKQILVDKLIKAGEIDGYKRVGASCHDNRNFVRNNGESMRDLTLHIDCCLEHGDVLSYQDSFVYYDYNDNTSCNNSSAYYDYELDSTDENFELDGNYSDWNECIIPEGDSVYDDYYEDWMYSNQSEDAIYHGRHINVNGSRIEGDWCWCWSDYEDAYLFKDECCYVERERMIIASLETAKRTSTANISSGTTANGPTITTNTFTRTMPYGATLLIHGLTAKKTPNAPNAASGILAIMTASAIQTSPVNTIAPRSAPTKPKPSTENNMLLLL